MRITASANDLWTSCGFFLGFFFCLKYCISTFWGEMKHEQGVVEWGEQGASFSFQFFYLTCSISCCCMLVLIQKKWKSGIFFFLRDCLISYFSPDENNNMSVKEQTDAQPVLQTGADLTCQPSTSHAHSWPLVCFPATDACWESSPRHLATASDHRSAFSSCDVVNVRLRPWC